MSIDECFRKHLPDNLYFTHYELHNKYPTFTPDEWKTFLRSNDKFIQSELAAVTEANARAALSQLSANSDTTALRELMAKSKLISESQSPKETIVFSFIPPHVKQEEMPEPVVEEKEIDPAERW